MKYDFDLIVIGSGSGGSTGAHYAAAFGKKVAIVERSVIGGECPNFACVPTKALLQAAEVYQTVLEAARFGTVVSGAKVDYRAVKRWKDLVVSRTGAAKGEAAFTEDHITLIRGKAKFTDSHTIAIGEKTYRASRFLIATGSAVSVPPIPGLAEAGYVTFKQAVDFDKLPRSIFILGGGPIGCEFTQIFNTFGSEVFIADQAPRLLGREDKEVGDLIGSLFVHRGVNVLTNSQVTKIEKHGAKKRVYFEHGGRGHSVQVDEILVATGKKPVVDLELEKAGVRTGEHGITVNRYLQTTNPNIYAAGDVVGPYLYTHTGYYQSYVAARNAFSYHKMRPDYTVVPRCVFTAPEIASVGLTEEQAKEKKIHTKRGLAPIGIVGRANTSNELDGFVKVLTRSDGQLIGASIVAPRAGEMIHQLALAIKLRAKASDVASMIHAFPTFSEAIKIACSSIA